ncbi:MAG: AbrB/MazE/SpoVT family DNA-binding domain-containing protein [Anaerolineae bacterium]
MIGNTVQMRKKGNLTLPVALRNKYNLNEGDVFTLIDLGDSTFLLRPGISALNRLGDRVAAILKKEGVDLDSLLATLEEERERYYRERYAQA